MKTPDTRITSLSTDWEAVQMRLPMETTKQTRWVNRIDPDAISTDAGRTYSRLSERPLYQSRGEVYESYRPKVSK